MITVPRFEPLCFKKNTTILAKNKVSVKIKDHKTDEIVCIVNYGKNEDENMELASKIIEVIEEHIESE